MQALVTHVLGGRPNFMKAAPVIRAIGETGVSQTLIHTGQHYDARMSGVAVHRGTAAAVGRRVRPPDRPHNHRLASDPILTLSLLSAGAPRR
jgi:hypothetical protein